jgi:tetratricopeptide (TPR) repeat protein
VKGTLEEIARAAFALAGTFRDQGRLDQAEVCFTQALTLAEQGLGPHDALLPEILHGLAFTCQAQGRLPEAESHLRHRVALLEQNAGDAYDGEGLQQLAGLCGAQGRASEAATLLERAVALKEKQVGPDHFDVAMRLGDLCELYEARDRFADARPLRERMIVILAQTWGPFDPQLPPLLEKLAHVCDRLNDTAAAAEHRQSATTIRDHATRPRN